MNNQNIVYLYMFLFFLRLESTIGVVFIVIITIKQKVPVYDFFDICEIGSRQMRELNCDCVTSQVCQVCNTP